MNEEVATQGGSRYLLTESITFAIEESGLSVEGTS